MNNTRPQGYWDEKLKAIVDTLRSRGFEIREELVVYPPIKKKHLDAFVKKSGISLPDDLRDFLENHMGGFELIWVATDDDAPFQVGGFEGGFIGAKPRMMGNPIQKSYDFFQNYPFWWLEDEDDEYFEENKEILPKLFPLAICCGGGADLIALHTGTEPCDIVYLDHEMSHTVMLDGIIERGFYNFLEKWFDLYLIELTMYCGVVLEEDGTIDIDSKKAKEWRAYLGVRDS